MAPIPKDYPLESFDHRIEDILKRGARGEDFTIQCKTSSQAHRLQHMLHSYRHRAKAYFGDEAPERWKPLYGAIIGLVKDAAGRKTILHVHSRNDEFSDVLDSIAPPTDPEGISAEPEPPRPDPLDEFEPHNGTAKPEGSGGK